MLRCACVAAIALAVLTPAAATMPAEDGIIAFRAFAGEPYRGRVSVRVTNPEDPRRRLLSKTGQATAQFVEDGEGQFRFVLKGGLDAEGDAGFSVTGTLDEKGWHAVGKDMRLSVGLDGGIEGAGTEGNQKMAFDGRVTRNRVRLNVTTEMTEKTAGGFPAGTVFRFTYNMRRTINNEAKTAKSTAQSEVGTAEKKRDGKCRRIVWQPRAVPNLSGGPMGMIQVPVCMR